jgi:hypothetical protein
MGRPPPPPRARRPAGTPARAAPRLGAGESFEGRGPRPDPSSRIRASPRSLADCDATRLPSESELPGSAGMGKMFRQNPRARPRPRPAETRTKFAGVCGFQEP